MKERRVDISVIVPTLNEAENIPELLRRLDGALAGKRYEVLIVDDNSRDDTREVCASLSDRFPVRLLIRRNSVNGLSGAVLHGIGAARGHTFVVMDADLQHPPEQAPELLAELARGADFAIGSRYTAGGSIEGGWNAFRKVNSKVATVLARPFARGTTDPMSGFFAIGRDTFQRGQRLTPLGYKVGLELMCKCRVQNVHEIPIHFAIRTHGDSKLTLTQQFKYLEHLSRLYDFFFPRASPIAKFLIVTLLGWSVGLSLYSLLDVRGWNQTLAVVLGYLTAILMTAMFHNRYVRTQREFLITKHPWREFVLTSSAELSVCVLGSIWLKPRLANPGSFDLPVLCFLAATAIRYVLRKELMQDIRGLRRDPRFVDIQAASPRSSESAVVAGIPSRA